MNKPYIAAILAITSLAFSASARAQNMSKSEYRAAEKSIEAEYKSAKEDCSYFPDNAKNICMAIATGNKKVAKTELEARYKPSNKAGYEVSIAKAEAEYAVAKIKCDDQVDNAKDVCVKEAKASLAHERADAMEKLKASRAMILAK